MIRRNRPLADLPTRWLMIPQREHARLSCEIAESWGNGSVPPLVCVAHSPDDALLTVRNELLSAIRLHDEGWAVWEAAPRIDPEYGRPYGFTEMPPVDAQALWGRSIDACRELGPLAGWIVAGHFITLQSPRDDDYHEWKPWLARQEQQRKAWLQEWLSASPNHTKPLAERCQFLLRTFDWISLWLCCRAPLDEADPPESMRLHDEDANFGPFQFNAQPNGVTIDPWPLAVQQLELSVEAACAKVKKYSGSEELLAESTRESVGWKLGKV